MRTGKFPKRIFSLWYQGIDSAPELVRLNWKKWRELNPSYELVILDSETCEPYLEHLPFDANCLTHQARSDIIRLSLLSQHGGIWTDASVLPLRPLDDWLEAALSKSDFFAYERAGYTLPLSSWFLAAKPDALIPKRWHDLSKTYWLCERSPLTTGQETYFVPEEPEKVMKPFQTNPAMPYPYFWVHHLFGILLQTDAQFQNAWNSRLRVCASVPHRLAEMFHEETLNRRGLKRYKYKLKSWLNGGLDKKIKLAVSGSEMQKLDWRQDYPLNLLADL